MQLVCYNLPHNAEMFPTHAICEEAPCAEGNLGGWVGGGAFGIRKRQILRWGGGRKRERRSESFARTSKRGSEEASTRRQHSGRRSVCLARLVSSRLSSPWWGKAVLAPG